MISKAQISSAFTINSSRQIHFANQVETTSTYLRAAADSLALHKM
jgi:hypothetical protein